MPVIGFSDVYAAKYNNNNGVVSYSGGIKVGAAVDVDISIATSNKNEFYADNALQETDSKFSNGNIKYTPDDTMDDERAFLLGIEPTPIAGEDGDTELIYDDDMESPYVGWGGIIKKRKNGKDMWRAVFLTKLQFRVPNDTAKTQGENIDWQTTPLEGDIMRDDTEKHAWKKESTFDTREKAVAYIKAKLNIQAAPNG